ncbi:MAG: hypothetical protein GMKNLPBB_03271 [Myxococcota bacterium]|jgi:multicomponent Na+:H+ antiporter subunit E|nr:hypothetical protein [Myxococcota bacterium]
MRRQRAALSVRSSALGALLALLWFVLTGGAVSSWIVGVPTIAAALVLARQIERLTSPLRLDPAGVLGFVTYFLRESVRGGIDVAGRVSARRLRVAPGLVRYRWRLPADGPARALFALSASLLPGTLVAAVGEHEVLIHALDAKGPVPAELAELEQRVAGLFALRLSAPGATDA